ncbi:hypothetical protein A3Q56_03953 [Intoshia linei]|uniref:Uncharacterized protein n=1 Tax=Intoshia linei TaxID=1819745 RepID=A0A177B207_9BILA|nr:hypothetical protein A3Q56_03953 [Intoshia linei]
MRYLKDPKSLNKLEVDPLFEMVDRDIIRNLTVSLISRLFNNRKIILEDVTETIINKKSLEYRLLSTSEQLDLEINTQCDNIEIIVDREMKMFEASMNRVGYLEKLYIALMNIRQLLSVQSKHLVIQELSFPKLEID